MRRFALMTGIAIGYVLGTRAGRERYVQISNAYRALRESPPAQQLTAKAGEGASKAGQVIKEKAAAGVSKGTEKLRRNANGRNAEPAH